MKHSFAQHWLWFRLALVFLTRLPVPIKQQLDDEDLNYATGYFAVVGIVVALLFSFVVLVGLQFWSVNISIAIAMAFGLLLTGAFHEDGLADTFDGLGGGWDVETKLNIMKDSRLGTYSASALFFALLIKFQFLVSIAEVDLSVLFVAIVLAHGLSRACAVSVMTSLDYVQLDAQSKTKPVAKSLEASSKQLLALTAVVLVTLCYLFNLLSLSQILLLTLVLFTVRWLFITFIRKQLGGYTGDVLGAAQQVFELTIYAVLATYVFESASLIGLTHG